MKLYDTLGRASRGGILLATLGLSALVGCGVEEQDSQEQATAAPAPEAVAAAPGGDGQVSAMFTATCTDLGCDFKDPQYGSNCYADPGVRTVCTGYAAGGLVELRYSPACKSLWARTRRGDSRQWELMQVRVTVGSKTNFQGFSGYDAIWSTMFGTSNSRCGKAEGWFHVGSSSTYATCQGCGG